MISSLLRRHRTAPFLFILIVCIQVSFVLGVFWQKFGLLMSLGFFFLQGEDD